MSNELSQRLLPLESGEAPTTASRLASARFGAAALLALLPIAATATPTFDAGSDGSYGALIVPANTSLEVPLPSDGVIHATEVTIETGGLLQFARNTNNTPVYLLSQGDIVIDGTLDVSGSISVGSSGGQGGPGGFNGGNGRTHWNANTQPRPIDLVSFQSLFHLVGGMGGNGRQYPQQPCGGGGGGGGLLLASSSRVVLTGLLTSDGGSGACLEYPGYDHEGAPGAPGHVRVVAPEVVGAGEANAAIIRVDAIRSTARDSWTIGNATFSQGATMAGRLSSVPQVRIVSVGNQVVTQEDGPVSVTFPAGSPRIQNVVVEVSGYPPNGVLLASLQQKISGGQHRPGTTVQTHQQIDLSLGNQATIPMTFEPLTGTWLDVVVQ